jgi:transcriptional regulator with XRE-family HTH domain
MVARRVEFARCRATAGFTQGTLAEHLEIERSTVSRWERGITAPHPWTRPKLANALKISPKLLSELLGDDGDSQADNRTTLPRPRRQIRFGTAGQVDDVVFHLREQWHLLVKTDNLLGPRYAVCGVLDQLATIEDLLATAAISARREVVRLGAQYAESASWLFEDSGDIATARHWNNRAMEWAHEADDYLMLSWSLFRRSQQAVASRNAVQVISLAQAAARTEHELLPAMRAAIAQQEARGHAMDGDERTAQSKLDEAHEWAATDTIGDARGGHGSFCTTSYIELQRADCWLTLGNPDRAIHLYETTMPLLPTVYRRDRGKALGRLASAYVAIDEPEQAARVASEALDIAESVGSARTLAEIHAVGKQLTSDRQLAPVADLLDELAMDGSS